MSESILPVATTAALEQAVAEFGLDILQLEEVGDLLCSHEALRATVAALTAENERLRERLRLIGRLRAGLPSSRETTDG